jgi:hypothetical protein
MTLRARLYDARGRIATSTSYDTVGDIGAAGS